MFQYACLRGVASRRGVEVCIPKGPSATVWGFPVRAKALESETNFQNVFRERRFGFNPEVFEQPDDTNFIGFFQSEKYFIHIEKEIKMDFRFSKKVTERIKGVKAGIKYAPVIAVHVRRGDYVRSLAHANLYGNYYNNAMSLFTEGTYVFISDDLNWCRKRFYGNRIKYFSSGSVFGDLAMMTICDHVIIANSTFSWWGAWLNLSPQKQVLRPATWWGPKTMHLEAGDICPDSWKPIPI